jgi:hypothetical protein
MISFSSLSLSLSIYLSIYLSLPIFLTFVLIHKGNGTVPARVYDNHYISGVGLGGLSGKNGGPGHCVVIEYNPRTPLNYQTKRYFFVGTTYTYRIAGDN